ncbi:MAG: septal ring lytic transglycosylase RlpA family protein [Bacteriovoracaceae bacterium]|nr:septal ring lytic transglycosylase RlpA family protein [Bacteroidota bacterium]
MNTSKIINFHISKFQISNPNFAVWNFFVGICLSLFIASCASSPRFTQDRFAEPKVISSKSPVAKNNGKATSAKGIASYYADDFHGKKTANGEQFDMHALTAAHRSFPFNTKVKVTNMDNGKSCVVRVNDRGPFKLERIMDLSLGAAETLDMLKTGTANVMLEVLEWGE